MLVLSLLKFACLLVCCVTCVAFHFYFQVLIVPLYDTLMILGTICVDIVCFGAGSMTDVRIFLFAVAMCCFGMFVLTIGQRHASYFHESSLSISSDTLAEIDRIMSAALNKDLNSSINGKNDILRMENDNGMIHNNESIGTGFTHFKEYIKSKRSNYGSITNTNIMPCFEPFMKYNDNNEAHGAKQSFAKKSDSNENNSNNINEKNTNNRTQNDTSASVCQRIYLPEFEYSSDENRHLIGNVKSSKLNNEY